MEYIINYFAIILNFQTHIAPFTDINPYIADEFQNFHLLSYKYHILDEITRLSIKNVYINNNAVVLFTDPPIPLSEFKKPSPQRFYIYQVLKSLRPGESVMINFIPHTNWPEFDFFCKITKDSFSNIKEEKFFIPKNLKFDIMLNMYNSKIKDQLKMIYEGLVLLIIIGFGLSKIYDRKGGQDFLFYVDYWTEPLITHFKEKFKRK